jgi:hypothetical protein
MKPAKRCFVPQAERSEAGPSGARRMGAERSEVAE